MKTGYCSGKENGSMYHSKAMSIKICWKCDDINQKSKSCLTCSDEFLPRCGSRFVCEECYKKNSRKLDIQAHVSSAVRL